MENKGKTDPYIVPGLVRGLSALRLFTPDKSELTLKEIAESLNVSKSAVFRTVHTLVHEGYLLEVPEHGRFKLGPGVLQLTYGYHASRELLEVSTPMLTRLRDLTDWSTHLGVLDGQYVMYLLRFAATSGLSSLVHVGSRLPAAATSMGRLMLCPKSEPAIRRLYKDSPAQAVQKILDVRRQDLKSDLIVSIGNFESGLCSVAAPIFDMSGEMIGAISTTRVTDTVPDSILAQTRTAASQISRALGAR